MFDFIMNESFCFLMSITMDGGMGFGKNVATLAVVAVLTWLPLKAVGAESAYDCGTIPCDEFVADASDQASLQHGAALYANYCGEYINNWWQWFFRIKFN